MNLGWTRQEISVSFFCDTWAHRISYSDFFVEKFQFQGTVPALRMRTTGERRPSANLRYGDFRFLIELAVICQGMHHGANSSQGFPLRIWDGSFSQISRKMSWERGLFWSVAYAHAQRHNRLLSTPKSKKVKLDCHVSAVSIKHFVAF